MRFALIIIWLAAALPAMADTVFATRNVRPFEILTAEMVHVEPSEIAGAATALNAVLGKETQVALYANRPVMPDQISEPAIVDRNAIVPLIYRKGGLRIEVEGRSLGRGAVGDRLRVMNLQSKVALFATVQADGSLLVTE